MRLRSALSAALLALSAPAALAQTASPTPSAPSEAAVASDSLLARAGRAEAAFFAGRTAELRALSDSTFGAMLTDEGHQQILAQVSQMGGAASTGPWTAIDVQGMKAYRRPYALAGMDATLLVVFDATGRVAGLALRPGQG